MIVDWVRRVDLCGSAAYKLLRDRILASRGDRRGKPVKLSHAIPSQRESHNMGLKAPSIVTFMLSVILTVVVVVVHFFDADIPFLKSQSAHFFALLMAQLILVLGCMLRGM